MRKSSVVRTLYNVYNGARSDFDNDNLRLFLLEGLDEIMKNFLETLKKLILGGIILAGIVILYLWVTADKCYYAIKKRCRR